MGNNRTPPPATPDTSPPEEQTSWPKLIGLGGISYALWQLLGLPSPPVDRFLAGGLQILTASPPGFDIWEY